MEHIINLRYVWTQVNGKLNIDLDGVSSATHKLGELQFEEEEEDAFYNKVLISYSIC